MPSVLVLGSGLIGSSIGLALTSAGEPTVLLHDVRQDRLREAVDRGAGRPWDGSERVQIVIAAGPPKAIAGQLREAQRLDVGRTYTHVASVQSQVQREVEALGCDLSSVVGGHPLAGRETSGPSGATADLFVGRPWAVCASPEASAEARADVHALALACGALPLDVAADVHDRAVALLSHLPQVASSALAALLPSLPESTAGLPDEGPGPGGAHDAGAQHASARLTALSGNGLVDTTRLAAGSPELWTDILTANAEQVAPVVRDLAALLTAVASDLDACAGPEPDAARARVRALLERGNQGRALVPVKRGVRDEGFARVAVEVDDRPGRLAALLTDAGEAGVNVEDVRVDHVPGRPTGLIELLVDRDASAALAEALRVRGWRVA